jgi:hypothetical protein
LETGGMGVWRFAQHTQPYRPAVHHDVCGVVIEHGRDILARKRIGGVRDKKTCLTDSTITVEGEQAWEREVWGWRLCDRYEWQW